MTYDTLCIETNNSSSLLNTYCAQGSALRALVHWKALLVFCHSPDNVPGSRDASSISQMFRSHNEVKCLIQGQAARKQSQVSPKSDSVLPPFYMHARSHSYILTCLHTFKHTDTPTHTDMFTYTHTYLITLTFSNAHTHNHICLFTSTITLTQLL